VPTSYPELRDRVVVVTGAARGLGAALAVAFAAQGSRLALVDVDSASLELTARRLDAGAGDISLEAVDLADISACEQMVHRVAAHFGRLDVLVNNAAVIRRAPMEDVEVADFELALRVNLLAPWFLARAAIAVMRRAGRGGRIVNVASMAGRTGGVGDIHPYAASKGGLLAVTKSLARETAADGILVNAILPSNIESPMLRETFPPQAIERTLSQVPLGRTAEPHEVAELVLWLASDASSYVTGANWDINGGWVMS
jgi:NAD(P)-dependent dehydrogenase (short-subunit alcohol dehydrogenase family)